MRRRLPVFPTHVGMNRRELDDAGHVMRVPHARGDEPHFYYRPQRWFECSPRTWGGRVLYLVEIPWRRVPGM